MLLYLLVYVQAGHVDHHMNGMPMDLSMTIGMTLIVIGLLAAPYDLVPRRGREIRREAARIRIRALDDAPLRGPHIALLTVMAITVTIDATKPTALAFVTPGFAQEYGLKSPMKRGSSLPLSWLPLAGITGTAIGSFDRHDRDHRRDAPAPGGCPLPRGRPGKESPRPGGHRPGTDVQPVARVTARSSKERQDRACWCR
ncbi:hypothetical protein ACFW2Y_04950 [Streptomyces sp. NPDC058877]|uniref:hypothetical protein n=1 Tax=unclassified Streptomyces TaxID=2593676 RepID=UPI0036819FCB